MARTVKIFGRKLAEARERLHLTQTELGQKLSPPVTDEAIGRIENGQDDKGIYSKRLPQLASALKMSLDEVMRQLVVPGSGSTTATKGTRAAANARAVVAWLKRMIESGEEEGLIEALTAAFSGRAAVEPQGATIGDRVSADRPSQSRNSPKNGRSGGKVLTPAGTVEDVPRLK